MLRSLGTLLFLLELLLLALPVTGLALLGGLFVFSSNMSHPDAIPFVVAFLLGYVALFGFWSLTASFLYGGPESVKRASVWVSGPAALGGFWALAVLLVALPPMLMGKAPVQVATPLTPLMLVGACGVPLLIPIAHILICVWRAGNSSEQTQFSNAV